MTISGAVAAGLIAGFVYVLQKKRGINNDN